MKLVVQRVSRACVRVAGEEVASIRGGLLVLLAVIKGDTDREAERLALRLARFRIFGESDPGESPDADPDPRPMQRAIHEVGGSALVVSQFTLAADGREGRRPSFDRAAPPEVAEPLVERFVQVLETMGVPCSQGRFGARMEVELVNDGPVTFVLEEPSGGGSNKPKRL